MTDRELLVKLLIERGVAESEPGYGHATADQVADVVEEWLNRRLLRGK